MKVGDRVKRADADEVTSIPAYRSMRGTVAESTDTLVWVTWDMDHRTVSGPYVVEDITLAAEEEER